MTTLEKIRAEIDCYLKNNEFGTEYRNDIKNIIAKYAEQEPTKEEQALLQKWRDNRGVNMEEFSEALDVLKGSKGGEQ